MGGGEHGSAGGDYWGEGHEADFWGDVVVDGFHASAHGVGFVPEAGASCVAEEVPPPEAVWVGAGPFEERIHVAPVLAHAGVHGEKGEYEIFVAEEAVGLGGDGAGDFGAESNEGFEAGDAVDAHTEVDDDQVGILGEVDGVAVDGCGQGWGLRSRAG